MNSIFRILLLAIAAVLPFTTMASEPVEGQHYAALANPQPISTGDRIEVVELFWYGCPSCNKLEPFIEHWLQEGKQDDTEFVRMPAVVNKRWELLAKAYYTSELLGKLDTLHPALFAAIHDKKQKIADEAALKAFYLDNGVTEDEFNNTFNSFAVNVKLGNARQMSRKYAITGVPSLVVNGKYRTSVGDANGFENVIAVVNHLVDRERGTQAPAAAE
jgi:thiol:disulfide interchange protein DsbA